MEESYDHRNDHSNTKEDTEFFSFAMSHIRNELINYKFWSRSRSNDVRHIMTTKNSVICPFSVLHFCKDKLSA